jgi:hypothetical protein
MAYEPKPIGNRLGIYADKIEAIREQRGLTPAGADKEAALAELYRRADSHLPPGIGGPVPEPSAENAPSSEYQPDSETAGSEENDNTEAP